MNFAIVRGRLCGQGAGGARAGGCGGHLPAPAPSSVALPAGQTDGSTGRTGRHRVQPGHRARSIHTCGVCGRGSTIEPPAQGVAPPHRWGLEGDRDPNVPGPIDFREVSGGGGRAGLLIPADVHYHCRRGFDVQPRAGCCHRLWVRS